MRSVSTVLQIKQDLIMVLKGDSMTNNEITFPIGYYDFHKDKGFNFQLNRWYSIGFARYEDMKEAGQRINSFKDWKIEMLRLADIAISESRLINGAFYYRAAEFFTSREDPDKELLYNKFINTFYKVFQDDEIEKYEVPYNHTFLPAIKIQPIDKDKRGTIVLHGGFDSFMEEFYSMIRYFSGHGYEVIAFDGPGQGTALKKYGLVFDYEWERPAEAILDHFNLDDVSWFGISMGGWLGLRAAAFEPRIKRIVASSVSFGVNQYANIVGQLMAKLLFKYFKGFVNNAMVKKMKKDLMYSWFSNNLMYITDKKVPIDGFDVLLQLNEGNLRSDLVKQDVMILTGRKDHMIPLKMHKIQVQALTNAKSITDFIFTEEMHAQNHCQVGNVGLALETVIKWIEQKS